MRQSWVDRWFKSKPRPVRRPRPARARLGVEHLEARLVPAVFANFVNGQLQVTDNSFSDLVTLDHSGATTFVNGSAFADSQITNGILIRVGSGVGTFDKVNILATVKPVTVDGQFDVDEVNLGKNGSMQGIQAPVTLIDIGTGIFTTDHNVYKLTLDDSADTVGRTVTLNVVNSTGIITGLTGQASATISFDDIGLNTLTINGGSGGNTFNVLHTPTDGTGGFTDLNTGTGNDTVNVLGTDGQPDGGTFTFGGDLSIQGQGGNDTVRVGNAGSVQGILGFVHVANTGGFTTLFVDDSADKVARNVSMRLENFSGIRTGIIEDLAPEQIQYEQRAVSFVQVAGGSGGNTFTIEDTFKNGTTSNTTRINTGFGSDQVFVHRTTGSLEINGQSGLDRVNISSAIFPNGSLQGILGNINITNAGSRSQLTVNGAADAFNHTVTLAAAATLGEIRNLAPAVIFYTPNDIGTINLNGGNGNDTFFVTGTGSPAPLQVNGLGGNDTFIVGNRDNSLDEIRTPLTLNGNSGFDTLIINDQGDNNGHFYGITASAVTRDGVTINYASIDALQVNKSSLPIVFTFPPMVTDLAFTGSIRAGGLAALSGRLVDQDEADVLSLTVDWGDGSPAQTSTPNRTPFHLTHAYTTPGVYTVRAIWTDSSGESNFQDLKLTVTPPPPAGSLDDSFGTHGKVRTDFGFANDIANAVAIQPDGKIVVGGWAGNDFSLARYNPDGSLDKTFGTGGKVTTNFANGTADSVDDIDGIVIQSDGKIVAVGGSNGDFALARYLCDGKLDTTFGTGGKVVTDFGGLDRAQDVVLQADGRIVVVGSAGGNFAVARYLADGTLDSDFDADGKVVTDFGFANDIANSVAIQPDGKIVAGGWAGNDFSLARYNPDGSLDQRFGKHGKVVTNFANGGPDSVDDIHSIVIQPDGKIVAGGTAGGDFGLARYLPDGKLDKTFGKGGKVVTDFGGGLDRIRSLVLQPDGKIVAAGETASGGGGTNFALARYTPDGKLDTTFSFDGKVATDLAGGNDVIKAVALQPDGKIVAVGAGGNAAGGTDFALVRYEGGVAATLAAQKAVVEDGLFIDLIGSSLS